MRSVSRAQLAAVFILGLILLTSAFALVELHYRSRLVFVAHEHEVGITRRLLDDQADLQMKVRRAALPGTISAGAAMIGLEGATGENTYALVEDESGRISFAEETKARVERAEAIEREKAEAAAKKAAERAQKAAQKAQKARSTRASSESAR